MSALTLNQKYSGSSSQNIFAIRDVKDFGVKMAAKVRDVGFINQGTAFSLHYSNVGIAYVHLYGLDVEGDGANAIVITRTGEQGSIADMRIPAAAGQARKIWNVIVGPELSWTAVATTNDFASKAEAKLAKDALQYYLVDKGVSPKAKAQAFEAITFAEAALHIPWNEDLGDPIAPEPLLDESGQQRTDDDGNPLFRILRTGDIDYRPISTWDIIRDPTAKSFDQLKWICVREWQNKFDVAARCKDPETAQAALSSSYMPQEIYRFWRPFNLNSAMQSDLIPVYYLYHKPTGSVPEGRQTEFLDNGAVITDDVLDEAYHDQWPVARMAVGEYSGTPFPYSKWFSTLGAEQAADSIDRDLVTNITSIAGNLIWSEEDADVPVNQLGGGGPRLMISKKKPEAIQLQLAHPESFKLSAQLRGIGGQIMGMDRITSGEDVGANLSGAAMALMTSTTVQNNSQEQGAWGKFMQDIGNITLKHIQYHMKEPRKIALAGQAQSDLVTTTELAGYKVKGIARLQVQLAPALQQTDAGKMQMAETALKEKWAKTPQQAQAVFDSGRLDALTGGLSAELLLIASENEALARGEDVPVMASDNHALHLNIDGGHPTVTASLTARRDPRIVDAVQAHNAKHIEFLQKTDPKILQLYGQPSLAEPPPQGPPPMSDSTKLGAANLAVKSGFAQTPQAAEAVFKSGDLTAGIPPPQTAQPGNPPPVPGAPAPQAQQQAQAPKLPVNPSTGQPAGPVAGTMPPNLAVKPATPGRPS